VSPRRAARIRCAVKNRPTQLIATVAIVGVMTDSVGGSAVGEEDETTFWLSVPGLRESLAEADADYAAGRTYGEEEIRARYGLAPRDTS
jgi:hypothetical protein